MFLIAIIALSVLIFIHELGHFVIAKMVGVKVIEFSLGFGPKIFRYQRGDTTYGIGILPAGGYVKLAGMGFEEKLPPEEEPHAFSAQPIWKKVGVVSGGPAMNFFLGIFLFWLAFLIMGVPFFPNTLSAVRKNSPAYQAGIKPGDKIIAIDGNLVDNAQDVIKIVKAHPLEKVAVKIIRDGEQLAFEPTLGKWQKNLGFLGVQFQVKFKKGNPILALKESGRVTMFVGTETLKLMGDFPKMFGRLLAGKSSGLIGPVGFVRVTTKIAYQGLVALLSVLAGLSISLAIFQLIPLPPLDGGHLLFAFLERLKGSPIDRKTIIFIQTIGVSLLLMLFLLVTYSDVVRPIPRL